MKHAVITGGSSGIGLSLARQMLARGYRVSLLARREELLKAAKTMLVAETCCDENALHIESVDVCNPQALSQALTRCKATLGDCDILVTSAGIVAPNPLELAESNEISAQIATNLAGTIQTVKAVYGSMVARRAGQIMVISSGAAFIGLYGYTAYCASKWGLRGFVEALRCEAREHNVTASICYPPDTLTPQYFDEITKRPVQAVALMGKVKPVHPDYVAQQIMRALDRGKLEVNFGLSLRLLAYLGPIINPAIYMWARFTHAARQTPTFR